MTGWKFALGATVPAREEAVKVAIIGRTMVRNQCIFEMVDVNKAGNGRRDEGEVEREYVEFRLVLSIT